MVVKKVEMSSGQPLDLGQRIVYPLRVEAAPALKERVFIAEVAVLRTAARHHNGIRHQVIATPNQVAPNGWNPLQRAACGEV